MHPTSGRVRGGSARPGVGGGPGRLRERGATGGWGTGPGQRTLPIYPAAKSVGDVSLACGRGSAHTGVASHILLLRPTQLSRGSTAGPPSLPHGAFHPPHWACSPHPELVLLSRTKQQASRARGRHRALLGTAASARGCPNLNSTCPVACAALPAEPQRASLGDRGAFGCTL